jgi:hypothetical protein
MRVGNKGNLGFFAGVLDNFCSWPQRFILGPLSQASTPRTWLIHFSNFTFLNTFRLAEVAVMHSIQRFMAQKLRNPQPGPKENKVFHSASFDATHRQANHANLTSNHIEEIESLKKLLKDREEVHVKELEDANLKYASLKKNYEQAMDNVKYILTLFDDNRFMLLPRLLHFLWPFVFLAGCWRRRL